jgi:glutaredoxin
MREHGGFGGIMSVTIFTSAGCVRCGIVKNCLRDRKIPFVAHDIKTAEGNAAFKAFYREHRGEIRRDDGGIFFPIVVDRERIVQDAGAALAWFICGSRLDAAVTPNNLGHGWIGGLDVSACDAENASFFPEVLHLLKSGGLAVSLSTNGENAALLRRILEEKLADRVEFKLAGTRENSEELALSLAAAGKFSGAVELRFSLDIRNPEGRITPAEAAEVARLMADATGDNRLPLRIFDSSADRSANLFPYRTEARRWQVLTELA